MKLLLRYGGIAVVWACPMVLFGQSPDSPHISKLDELVVTASRTAQKRTEAPVAISTISSRTIADTKANQLDQLLNKVSGVFMVDLGTSSMR
jgi:outer membrane cobalamin receptor